MARTREFDPDVALERALALFWEKGYGDSSFDDIVETTGVSRYGLYEEFGSKRNLFRKALRGYMDRIQQQYQVGLRQPDASLPEIRSYFEGMMKLAEGEAAQRGCLICNTTVELARGDEEIASDLRGFFEDMVLMFKKTLHNAREKGELGRGINVDDWAVSLAALNQSSALMVRLGLDLELVRRNLEASLATLEGKAW